MTPAIQNLVNTTVTAIQTAQLAGATPEEVKPFTDAVATVTKEPEAEPKAEAPAKAEKEEDHEKYERPGKSHEKHK